MAISVLILGESGTGKSASMRNLDPATTLLIQSVRKPLPFRSADWKPITKDGGNVYVSDSSEAIVKVLERTKRDVVVIDDFQYIMANEFMRRSAEKGFEKFNDIGRHAWDIYNAINNIAENKRVYVLNHTDTDTFGNCRAKTIGKMLDDKITVEGLFTIVMRTRVEDGKYHFATKNSGSDTVKTPMGMFDDALIENDLAAIDAVIKSYYGV